MGIVFDVADLKNAQGLGVFLVSRSSGHFYRLYPVRDQREPRFWCIYIDLCSRSGVLSSDQSSHLAACGFSRAELIETFQAIKGGAELWLNAESQRGTRAWLMKIDRETPPPVEKHSGKSAAKLTASTVVETIFDAASTRQQPRTISGEENRA